MAVGRTLLGKISVALAITMLAVACSGEETAEPTPGADESPGGGLGGEELTLAMTRFGGLTLDPIQSLTDSSAYLRLMFDPLVGANREGTGPATNGVAESWEVSDDGTVYTFTLREGIEFHNGEALTADDVKFSLDRYKNEEANTPRTGTLSALIDSIEVLSPTEVQITLTGRNLFFLTLISGIDDPGGLIIPKDYVEEVGVEEFGQNPIGSGPYRLLERETGSHLTLERALDSHWAVGEPRYERITFREVPEQSTRLSLLRDGLVDFIDVGPSEVEALRGEGYTPYEHALTPVLYVMFQIGREPGSPLHRPDEPTQDINLRRALSLAIDRQELADTLTFGVGEPAGDMFIGVAGQPNSNPELPVDPFDPPAAQDALAETPWDPNGDAEPINLVLEGQPKDGWPQLQQIIEAMQAYWTEHLGLDSTISFRDFAPFRAEWADGSLPSTSVIIIPYTGSLDWHSTAINAHTCRGELSGMCDEELTRLHDEWGASTTMDEYVERANAFEEYVLEQKYLLPVFSVPQFFIGNDKLPSDYQGPGYANRDVHTRTMVSSEWLLE